jgi:hypothetical protein
MSEKGRLRLYNCIVIGQISGKWSSIAASVVQLGLVPEIYIMTMMEEERLGLEWENEEKNLGVVVDSSLRSRPSIQCRKAAKKGYRALGMIARNVER